jgi:hypothetical protein
MRITNVGLQENAEEAKMHASHTRPLSTATEEPKEAFLVRKAGDYLPQKGRRNTSGTKFFQNIAGKSTGSQSDAAGGGGSWIGAAKLAEGVGLDARRYIEALLNLNR